MSQLSSTSHAHANLHASDVYTSEKIVENGWYTELELNGKEYMNAEHSCNQDGCHKNN